MVKKQIYNEVISLERLRLSEDTPVIYLPREININCLGDTVKFRGETPSSDYKNMNYFGGDAYAMHSI